MSRILHTYRKRTIDLDLIYDLMVKKAMQYHKLDGKEVYPNEIIKINPVNSFDTLEGSELKNIKIIAN